MLARFKGRTPASVTRVIRYSQAIAGEPEEVFPLLCPTREADWLPGWEAELISTESGFAEEWCVFGTMDENLTGPGVWVFARHEAPELVDIVRFSPPVLVRIRIVLKEGDSQRTEIHWEYTLTGLTSEGNEIVERLAGAMPDTIKGATEALDHYIRTGELASG